MTQTIVLAVDAGNSRITNWDHRLLCTFCKDGTISLRIVMTGDGQTFRPPVLRGIKTVRHLIDGIEELIQISSLKDIIDYELISDAISPYWPQLAYDMKKLLDHVVDEIVPEHVQGQIEKIMKLSRIYPPDCNGLTNRRIRYYKTREAVIRYYISNREFPTHLDIKTVMQMRNLFKT